MRLGWTLGLVALVSLVGCGGASGANTGATAKAKEPATLTCPVLRGSASRDLAEMFGIDVTLAGRISRTMTLLSELERSAKALDEESRNVCAALARDLDAGVPSKLPSQAHPCELASERLAAVRRSLGAGSFAVSVTDLSCGVSKDRLARCAGECITGRVDVVSAVECVDNARLDANVTEGSARANGANACDLDFRLPEAAPSCVTQCGARALRDVQCTASIDVRLGDGGTSPLLTPERIDALRRDVPRLVALGASMAPRAADLVQQVRTIIDDLAESVDRLSHEDAVGERGQAADTLLLNRRVVVGAVLAGCVAPAFADTLRAGSALEGSLTGAVQLHAALVK